MISDIKTTPVCCTCFGAGLPGGGTVFDSVFRNRFPLRQPGEFLCLK